MNISKNCIRIPLVRKPDGTPFIWHNTARSRIEIKHGQKITVLQLEKGTPVILSDKPNHFRKIKGKPIPDLDGNTVASWVGATGQEEWDAIIIRHSKRVTCFSIPKGTRFQVQYQVGNAL